MPATLSPAAQGAQSRLAVLQGTPPYTWANGTWLCFNREDVKKRGRIIFSNCITGTRSRMSAMSRPGAFYVFGRIYMDATPANLDAWLPLATGTAKNGSNQFPLAETLLPFGLLIDKVNDVYEYTECYVSRLYLRGRQADPQASPETPELVELIVELIGVLENGGQAWDGGLSRPSNDVPYTFGDATITARASTRRMLDFSFAFDNVLRARYANSLQATSITPRDRVVKLRTTHPFTSAESDLYDQAFPGAAGNVTLTNGGYSFQMDFPMLQAPSLTPNVDGKVEIPLYLDMDCRSTGGSDEVTFTNDSTA